MIDRVDVFAQKNKVGTLALTKDKKVAFQYSENWLKNGFPINPFKLPLTNQVFISSSPKSVSNQIFIQTIYQKTSL